MLGVLCHEVGSISLRGQTYVNVDAVSFSCWFLVGNKGIYSSYNPCIIFSRIPYFRTSSFFDMSSWSMLARLPLCGRQGWNAHYSLGKAHIQ